MLTQFHTTSTEGTNQVITMLGPDWQVDVTDLVQDSLKVADARVAELVDRTVLVGLELGSSSLKVSQSISQSVSQPALTVTAPNRIQCLCLFFACILMSSRFQKQHIP